MNIFLVPYNWSRHITVALLTGSAALLAWWFMMLMYTYRGPWWSRNMETFLFFQTISCAIAFTSVLAEGNLRRRPLWRRLSLCGIGTGLTFFFGIAAYNMSYGVTSFALGWLTENPEALREQLGEVSLASLRYHIVHWVAFGWVSALGPLATRRGIGFFAHLFGGLAAGAAAAAVWQYISFDVQRDMYQASALAALTWGFLHGLLVWGVPDELYAGWVRVLSDYRYGHRIPLDKRDGSVSERFVGHFPRGMDVFLPAEQGVAELHVSFVAEKGQIYKVRGLSQYPTLIRSFLGSTDLHYDARRPAPLEATLSSEDVILIGDGSGETAVEFLMLPTEEQ